MNPQVFLASMVLTVCLMFVSADIQSDVAKQINESTKKITENVQNAQAAVANAAPGTSVAVSCSSDSAGNSNCVKNVSSSATGSNGVPPMPVVTTVVSTVAPPAVPPVPNVQVDVKPAAVPSSPRPPIAATVSGASSLSLWLSPALLLTLSMAVLTRYSGLLV